MSKGTPAFPCREVKENDHFLVYEVPRNGMTLRQYAAIKLRVPDSGEEWLDEMIKKSLWNEFAGKALEGLLCNGHASENGDVFVAAKIASDMMSELEKRGK